MGPSPPGASCSCLPASPSCLVSHKGQSEHAKSGFSADTRRTSSPAQREGKRGQGLRGAYHTPRQAYPSWGPLLSLSLSFNHMLWPCLAGPALCLPFATGTCCHFPTLIGGQITSLMGQWQLPEDGRGQAWSGRRGEGQKQRIEAPGDQNLG